MRWLLSLLVAVIVFCDIFDVGLSLGPGVSVKNGVLYLIALGLFFRMVIAGEVRIELPKIHALFVLWIGYAVVTSIVDALILHRPQYHLTAAVINLKAFLIDPTMFFLTVFYGLRDNEDARTFLKALVAAICIANVMTLADVVGILHISMSVGEEGIEQGRVYGFFGHANSTGTLIACMLPAMIALAATGRRLTRMLWYGGAFASAIVLIMTVSRGAFVAAFAAAVCGGYLCRRYVRPGRLVAWGIAVVALVVLVGVVASIVYPQTAAVLSERLIGQSSTVSVGEFTSGRSSIWATTLESMMDAPLSLITGFGWNAYESMPFTLSTHNYYLDLWFDLGIVGVACFVLIVRRTMLVAGRAIPLASGDERRQLLAFQFGMIAMLVAVFFTLIFKPWPYLWMYMGAMMRVALIAEAAQAEAAPELAMEEAQAAQAAPLGFGAAGPLGAAARLGADVRFGWVASREDAAGVSRPAVPPGAAGRASAARRAREADGSSTSAPRHA